MTQFFKDANNQLSSMRLSLILWTVGTFGIWAGISIATMTVQAVPMEVSAIIGVLAAGKAAQTKYEQKLEDTAQ
jgi:hypothetical protein